MAANSARAGKDQTPKNIVLLSDGTGNSAASPHKTNVWRMYQAIDLASPDVKQLAFYDDGVGTASFFMPKLLGLVFGYGVKRNVKDLYTKLCRAYQKNDRIYIFGFSRGAFTARVLAALIGSQGIISYDGDEIALKKAVDEAYKAFRFKNFSPSVLSFPFWLKHYWSEKNRSGDAATTSAAKGVYKPSPEDGGQLITFLGVWDSVDAYGAPIDELARAWDKIVIPLSAKDRDLSFSVEKACHALALDEQRESFEPMLWNENTDHCREQLDHLAEIGRSRDIEQVWFSGVHANVGGGYPDDSLAHVSLNWMIGKAQQKGLVLKEACLQDYREAANIAGPIYNNRSGLGNAYRFAPRMVELLCHSKEPDLWELARKWFKSSQYNDNSVEIDVPKIHKSVFERIELGVDGYGPLNLPEKYSVVDDKGTTLSRTNKLKAPCFIETQEQAAGRRALQGSLIRRIWGIRLIYLCTVFFAFLLAVGAYLGIAGWLETPFGFLKYIEVALGFVSDLIRLVPKLIGMLPGLGALSNWANEWSNHSLLFLLLVGAVWFFVRWAFRIKRGAESDMRLCWTRLIAEDQPHDHASVLSPRDGWFDSHLAKSGEKTVVNLSVADRIDRCVRLLVEVGSLGVLALAVVWCFVKPVNVWYEGIGGTCRITSEYRELGAETPFDPKNSCFDTGYEVEAGKAYQLVFTVPEEVWRDGNLKADAIGLLDNPAWQMYLAIGLRRHLLKGWFEPIIRVGNTWFDYYGIENSSVKILARPAYSLEMVFTARRSGRLYFYLNDAVTFIPGYNDYFYKNNCIGCTSAAQATLVLSEVGGPATRPASEPESEREANSQQPDEALPQNDNCGEGQDCTREPAARINVK